MNLLVLEPDELLPDGTARLVGRRLAHAREVWDVQAGDRLRAGVQLSAENLRLSAGV